MSEYVFLFDLDATITKVEILPEIAAEIGKASEMRELTERTMAGEIPFEESFRERVNILRNISVSRVRDMITQVPLNEKMADFIRNNNERCYVVTGNIDVWIEDLMKKLGLARDHYFCSTVKVENDHIIELDKILDKALTIRQFETPFVAIGDGNNDAEMIGAAEVGIGFGGVRDIAPSVLRTATHAVYSEDKLCQFLKQLL